MTIASSRVGDPFFEAVVTSTPEGILSIDDDGTIVFATPYVEQLLGYSPEELIDRQLEEFVADEDGGSVLDAVRGRLETGTDPPEHPDVEIRMCHKAGHDVFVSLTPAETQYDDRPFVTAVLREDEERRDRDRESVAMETRYRKTFEYATDSLLIVDPESDSIEACNQEACDLLGYAQDELHERGPSDLHPDEMDAFRAFADDVIDEGDGFTDELTCHTAGGETFPAEVSAVAIDFDRRRRLLVRIRDVTGRRTTEREHREARALFKKIFEGSNDAILIFDPIADEFTEVNPRACELLGYSREELLGMGPSDIHPHEMETFSEFLEDVMEDGTGWTDELNCYTCEGELLPAEISMSSIELDGRTNLLASVRDVAERTEREALLKEEHERLSALFENSIDPIVEIVYEDEQPVIRGVNPAFSEVFGYDLDEVLDRTIEDVLVPEDKASRSTHDALARQVLDGHDIEAEVERETVSGSRDFLLRAVPFDIEDGSLGTYAIYTDITERKTYAQRLEALNEANNRLLTAETEQEIAKTAVDITERVLDHPFVALWSYDSEAEELVPLAASEPATDLDSTDESGVGTIGPGTAEMNYFLDGKPVLVEDYGELEDRAHPETSLGTLLLYPLGDHCLLNIGFATVTEISPPIRDLFDILAQNTRAAFERLERERAVRLQSAAMAESTDGMGITDDDGTFTYVNDALVELFSYDDPSDLIGTSWETLYRSDEAERIREEVLPTIADRGNWRGEATGERIDGTTFAIGMSLASLDDGGVVCTVRDVSDRKEQEQQLEALNEVARELMKADTRDDIAGIGVDACQRIVGCDLASIRTYDHETNRLEPIGLTDEARELLESQPAYDLEGTLAGHAFRRDETIINAYEEDFSGSPSPFEHASLHVPIGAYGVLSIVTPSAARFDDRDIRLAEMLAVNVRTAISRAERGRLLRKQQEELRNQRNQLETLNRINTLIQEIGDGLVTATTREELERTICSHLSRSDLYQSAWIGDVEEADDRVVAREGFGVEERYLEAMNELSLPRVAHGTVEQAIETKEVRVVRQYHVMGEEEITGDDVDPEVEATAAVPLVYGNRVHGVLVVNGARQDVFGESQVAGFESLGKLAGFAINAIRNRELLLSDGIVELELLVTDPSAFYTGVTEELDCRCQFERSVPLESDKVSNYHYFEGIDPETVLDRARTSDRIEEARVVSKRDDGFVLQTVTTRSPIQVALEAGTTLRSGIVEGGQAHITLEAPQSADVRRIIRVFDDAFASVEMIAKRERERSVQTADEFRQSVDARLTEKQCAAIEAAFASGYYDWPRETTAEELAESMGISSSTLHQHLRKGIWSLLKAFFEETRPEVEAA